MSLPSKVLIGLASLLLVLVLVIAALAAPVFVDRDALADRIETEVLLAVGQRPAIEGELRWRLLPTPRIELGPVRLPAAGEDARGMRLRIERLHVDLAIMPLLAGRVVLKTVAIDGLRLVAAPAGISAPNAARANASPPPPLAVLAVSAAAAPVPPPTDAAPELAPEPRLLPLQQLLVRDAELRWKTDNGERLLKIPELNAGPIVAGEQGLIEAALRLGGNRPHLDGDLQLTATLDPAADLSVVQLAPLRLTGDAIAIGALRDLPLALDAALAWQPLAGTFRIDDLMLESGGLRLLGQGRVGPDAGGPRLTAQIEIPAFDLRQWLEAAGAGPVPGALWTLRSAAANSQLERGGGELRLSGLRATIDATRAAGAAQLHLAANGLTTGVAAVALDRLDLDAYRLEPLSTQGASAPPQPVADDPGPALDADPSLPAPAADALVVRLDADMLRTGGLAYRDLTVLGRMIADGWRADIESADFYSGRLDAQVSGAIPRAPGGPMPATLSGAAEGVEVGALLGDTMAEPPLQGRGRVAFDLQAEGADAAAFRQSLGGAVSLAIEDGAITGLELDRLLATVGDAGAGSGDDAPGPATFSSFTASATGSEGLFQSDDIRARSPLLHIDGRGAIDVVAETLALDLEAVLVEPPSGAGMRELEGIPIPIDVTGPWTEPQWQVHAGEALREAARRALDEKLQDEGGLLQDLDERTGIPGLREGLERGLRGLFGR